MATMQQQPTSREPKRGMLPQQPDAYDAGMDVVRRGLFGAEAARDMAQAIKTAPSPEQGIADAAYQLIQIADEATEGRIPDERLIEFGLEVLSEVVEIAEAAGVQVKGSVVAKAVQMMLVRFVEEQGLDPTQLKQAMAKVDPEAVGAELDKQALAAPSEPVEAEEAAEVEED